MPQRDRTAYMTFRQMKFRFSVILKLEAMVKATVKNRVRVGIRVRVGVKVSVGVKIKGWLGSASRSASRSATGS